MEVSERKRRELHEALVGTIRPGPTDTLLGHLPPVGRTDVATQRDLDALESKIEGRMQHASRRCTQRWPDRLGAPIH